MDDEGEKVLIEMAAHSCESALLRGDLDAARIASEFAFFAATEAAKVKRGDQWK